MQVHEENYTLLFLCVERINSNLLCGYCQGTDDGYFDEEVCYCSDSLSQDFKFFKVDIIGNPVRTAPLDSSYRVQTWKKKNCPVGNDHAAPSDYDFVDEDRVATFALESSMSVETFSPYFAAIQEYLVKMQPGVVVGLDRKYKKTKYSHSSYVKGFDNIVSKITESKFKRDIEEDLETCHVKSHGKKKFKHRQKK
jgi:hypothetical protein